MPPDGAGEPEILTGSAEGHGGAGMSTEELKRLAQRVVTEQRHRNKDLIPGRVLHYVRSDGESTRCEAAILTQVKGPGCVDLSVFPPGGALVGRIDVEQAAELVPGSWHFTISCPRGRPWWPTGAGRKEGAQ